MFRTRLRSYFIICILFLFCVSQTVAGQEQQLDIAAGQEQAKQETNGTAPVQLDREYFTGYWTDTKNILTAPVRWDSTDWLKAGIITGIAVGLFTQDDKIQKWVQDHKDNSKDHLADDAKKAGTWSIPVLAGIGLYGYVAPNEKAKSTFLLSAESFLITGAFVQVLKRSTGRARPYTGHNHDTWSGPSISGNNNNLSFPSGDASSAFAIASVVASEYDNIIVPPLVYTVAMAIGLERVYNNAHWPSDVFIGSVIGYFTGKAVVASHQAGKENRLSLTPVLDGSEKGLMVTYRY
jgi:membrane-associated phospholipid phosphatase